MSNKTSYKTTVNIREKKLKNGNISLYLDIYIKGKRQYEFLNLYYNPKNTPEKREMLNMADEILSKKRIELIANDNNIISSYQKRSNYVEYFEKLCNGKPKGEKAYWNTLKYLKEFTKGNIAINSINETWLEEFKKFLLTKVSTNTAHTYFSKIKASLKQVVKDKILLNNPSQNIKQIPKKDTQRTYLTIDEVNKLNKTDCKNNQVKLAFLFACNTGFRLSDIKRLSWNDIKLDEKKIILTQKKTNEVIYLPLNDNALKILDTIRSQKIQSINNKVFILPCETLTTKYLKQWCERANINKNISFHTSRHTFATISLNSGVDIYTVSKLLGHKNLENTQIYAKVIDETMRKAVDKLPNLDITNNEKLSNE